MKKVLLGLVALSAVSLSAGNNIYLKGGVGFQGQYTPVRNYDNNYNKNLDTAGSGFKDNEQRTSDNNKFDGSSNGMPISADLIYTRSLNDMLEVGLGAGYHLNGMQNNQKVDTYSSITKTDSTGKVTTTTTSTSGSVQMPSYNSIPVYLAIKANYRDLGEVVPFVQANFGYSMNKIDSLYFPVNNSVGGDGKYNLGKDDEYIRTSSTVSKVTNGLYYSVGIGIEWKNFLIDLSYAVTKSNLEYEKNITYNYTDPNNAGYKGNSIKDEAKESFVQDFSRIVLGFGYKFSF